MIELEPCALEQISAFIAKHHRSKTCPILPRAKHCFQIAPNGDTLAAAICGPLDSDPAIVEFITIARLPDFKYPHSKLISHMVGQLRALKCYQAIMSWTEPDWGNGAMFKGASWHYSGRAMPSDEHMWRQTAQGFHLYWWPLYRGFTNPHGWLKLAYPQ